jgi:hypothetical protein
LKFIDASIKKIGTTLYEMGSRGSFGVDYLGFEDGSLMAVEINLRKVGTHHAAIYARSVIERMPKTGRYNLIKDKSEKLIHYVHRRFYEPELLKKIGLISLVNLLHSQNLAYDRQKGEGCILNILSAVDTCGYVELTSLSKNRSQAIIIDKQVQKMLFRFKP